MNTASATDPAEIIMESLAARISMLMFLSLLFSTSVLAGSIRVTVVDREGSPIAGQGMQIRPAVRVPGLGGYRSYARTDSNGVALLSAVPPAAYGIIWDRFEEPNIVPPADNPYVPVPTVTLTDQVSDVEVRVELWRGARVVFEVAVDRGRLPSGVAQMRNLDIDKSIEATIGQYGSCERLVVPGRWEMSLRPTPGYLLVGLEVDGQSYPGSSAVVELYATNRTTYITWSFAAPCLVTGRVESEGEWPGSAQAVATLLEPGAWIEAARARGGSEFNSVLGRGVQGDPEAYEMVLPAGRWLILAQGERLISSRPESVELELLPGSEDRVDFLVRFSEGDGPGLRVTALSPQHQRLRGVFAAAWPLTNDPAATPPLSRCQGDTGCVLSGLEAGDFMIVAGHRDFLEGQRVLPKYDPEGKRQQVFVTLEDGAQLRFRAWDSDQQSVADVALVLERLGEEPLTLLNDDELNAQKSRREASTDSSGYAAIGGLSQGRYLLQGQILGATSMTRSIRFVGNDTRHEEPEPELEVELGSREQRLVEITVLVSGSIQGRLACHDSLPPGPAVSVRLFSIQKPHRDRRHDPGLREGATLALDDLSLTGAGLSSFVAGPLEAGLFNLAVRPLGHQLWTWSPGGEDRTRAAPLRIRPGEPAEAGLIGVYCGATVDLFPRVTSGEPLPDLRDAEIRAYARPASEGQASLPSEPTVEVFENSIRLRDLPEGAAELEVFITHPHFLPTAEQRFVVEIETERGGLQVLALAIDAIGGSLAARGDGAVVHLSGAAGFIRKQPIADGEAFFGSLPPGIYQARLCADAECQRTVEQWEAIDLRSGQSVRLVRTGGR